MKPLPAVLAVVFAALAGCRPSPAEAERGWAKALGASLPAGWKVLVVTGDPKANRFVGWFEAPGPGGRTRRVELHVRPRPDAPAEREWVVHVHPPNPRARHGSVTFTATSDGAGPVEPAGGADDPEAVEAARPLAEEAVRQVRGLKLF